MDDTAALPRWRDYVLSRGDSFDNFWDEHLSSRARDLLFVLGRGFDPRMTIGIERILAAGGTGRRDCLVLEVDEGESSPSNAFEAEAASNSETLAKLLTDRGTLQGQEIPMWSDDMRRIGPRKAASVFNKLSDIERYSDIVVDISATPRGIYFPLIGKIMYLLDKARAAGNQSALPNLHVCVGEDPALDARITDEGVDDAATYLHGFGGGLDREKTAEWPRIWIPILGERQRVQLERIREHINPAEICPALPFPSLNPRRGDDLILEYHELLFDSFAVSPSSFIYVDERNPFEAYLQIRGTILSYQRVLQPLGGCKSIVSAQSSKLLSMSALLVAHELRGNVGIAHIGSQGFSMDPRDESGGAGPEMFGLWLDGECYE